MVGNMHGETTNRPPEEEALDQAMTHIDLILQASLKREQQRRRLKLLSIGGLLMLTAIGIFVLTMAIPGPQNGGAEPTTETDSKPARTTAQKIEDAERAEALMKEGLQILFSNPSAAEEKFQAAVALDAESDNLWNGLGWSQFQQQKFDSAAKSFSQCLELNSKHPAGLNGAGQTHLMLRDYEKAESYFLRGNDKTVPSLFGLARIQLLNEKYDAAKTTIRKLNKLDTGELDQELIKEMFAAARKKRMPKALKTKLEPVQIAATNPAGNSAANSLNAKGWRLFQQGKSRAAELAFREAVSLKQDHPGATNGLAFALLNQGKAAEAKPIFQKIVDVDPNHGGAINGLARCFAMDGDNEQALKLWQSVDDKAGIVSACTWGIAQTLTSMEKWDEALPYWERIKKAQPNDQMVVEMIQKCRKES